MIKEAIILAGGLGTRLRAAVPDLPKCMAPVAGKPFLAYVIDYFKKEGIERFIFSLGYKHEIIEEYLKAHYSTLDYQCCIEKEPLGTGGAVKLACPLIKGESALILNGDTLFKVKLASLDAFHTANQSDCTLSLKLIHNFDRYGVIELNEDNSIRSFKEKQFFEKGLINGGVYLLNIPAFLKLDLPQKFSFEKDYLEQSERHGTFLQGIVQEGYFIDIGIPADFEQAQRDSLSL